VRILSISNTSHDTNQGSGYVITGYVNGLRERGHKVDAYGPNDWLVANVYRARRYLYPLMIAGFGLWCCQSTDYDLIELWGGPTWLLAVCMRWVYPDTPVVHHSNGIEQHRMQVQKNASAELIQNKRWFQVDLSQLYDVGLNAADAIVTVSSYDLPFLKERKYLPEHRLFSIDNPLPDFFLNRDVQLNRPNRVGFCGSWIAVKNPSLLRDGVSSFLRNHPNWTFCIVGVGDTDVASQFPRDVREQIEVIPFLDREDLVDWYHSLAIFILPSVYESFGLVMAETMACGAALVATNVGFAHGLKHEQEALILPEAQSSHLVEALNRLVENEPLRQRIAQNGYERVQVLQWDEAVDRLEDIYQALVDANSSSTTTT
jgi:glycosyltransferase involved in cell wall biosynthesis